MYVGDTSSNITAFDPTSGKVVEQIPYPMPTGGLGFGGGAGVATDAQDMLYAGYVFDNGNNYPGKSIIYAFPPGTAKWSYKIAAGCCNAPTLAASHDGELAAFIPAGGSCCSSSFEFIKPDRHFPKYGGYFGYVNSFAFDSHGTCWADGGGGHGPVLGAYPRGSREPQIVTLHPAQKRLGALAIDARGNILIDESDTRLNAYDQHGNRAYTIEISGAVDITALALSRDGTRLYVGSYTTPNVLVYALPAGGSPIETLGAGLNLYPVQIAIGAI